MKPQIRILAIILLLAFLPASALGWDAYHYQFLFTVPPGVPGEFADAVGSILNDLVMNGTYVSSRDGFDIDGDLMSVSDTRTRVTYHLYGQEGLFKVESSLWDNMPLLINVPAALEFGMKMNAHMDLQLQKIGLLYHWVTQDAWRMTISILEETIHPDAGSHTVSRDTILDMARRLEENYYSDRSLQYWFYTMESLNPAGGLLAGLYLSFPEYLANLISPEGLVVSEENDVQIWKTGDTVIYRRQDTEPRKEITICLPGLVDGTDLYFSLVNLRNPDLTWNNDLVLHIGQDDKMLLEASMKVTDYIAPWPIPTPWTCTVSMHGPLLEGVPFLTLNDDHLLTGMICDNQMDVRIVGEQDHVTFFSGEHEILRLTVLTERFEPDEWPYHTYGESDGFNVFSLNDSSLEDLVALIKSPLIRGMIPWIEHLSYDTVSAVMDLLTQGGILELLAYGSGDIQEDDGEWERWDDWDDWQDVEYSFDTPEP